MEEQNRCDKCGAAMIMSQKGKLYCKDKCWLPKENQELGKQVVAVKPPVINEGIAEIRNLHQNSYEFGPACNRHTVRYWTIDELKAQVQALKNTGLVDIE